MSKQDPAPGPRVRLGLWLGGIYFTLATALFLVTALNTKPDNVGLDWIPFMVLTMPWSGMAPALMIPGVFLNTLALWLLGTLVQQALPGMRRS